MEGVPKEADREAPGDLRSAAIPGKPDLRALRGVRAGNHRVPATRSGAGRTPGGSLAAERSLQLEGSGCRGTAPVGYDRGRDPRPLAPERASLRRSPALRHQLRGRVLQRSSQVDIWPRAPSKRHSGALQTRGTDAAAGIRRAKVPGMPVGNRRPAASQAIPAGLGAVSKQLSSLARTRRDSSPSSPPPGDG